MQVIDNFLPEESFKKLEDVILGTGMPWYYCENISVPEWLDIKDEHAIETEACQSLLLDTEKGWKSEEFSKLRDVFYEIMVRLDLDPETLFRIRAVMTWGHPQFGEHNYNIPHIDSMASGKTLLLYMNDADGNTRLFDQMQTRVELTPPKIGAPREELLAYGSHFIKSGFTVQAEVEPKANRMLAFDGMQYHTAGIPRLAKRRVVINMNVA